MGLSSKTKLGGGLCKKAKKAKKLEANQTCRLRSVTIDERVVGNSQAATAAEDCEGPS